MYNSLNDIRSFLSCVLLAWCSLLSLSSVANETVAIDKTFSHISLDDTAQQLRIDANAQLSDVIVSSDWSPVKSNDPLAPGQALWLQFELSHQENLADDFVFSLDNPTFDVVDVFILDEVQRIVQSFNLGTHRQANNDPINHRNSVMPFELSPADTFTIYVRLIDDGPMVFSFDLWRAEAFAIAEQVNLTIIGVIAGALLILSVYFLVTYVLLRSPVRYWFSIASGAFFLLFLNIQGIVAQILGVKQYIAQATTILLALSLFAAAKVSHAMLVHVPAYWRFVSYIISILLVICGLVLNTYWQIITIVGLAGAALFLQLLLAILFHNRENSMPNRVYALGWTIISSVALIDVAFYLSGLQLASHVDLIMIFLIMAGVLLIAVAIEAHEQVIAQTHNKEQLDAISNLRKFYNLFRNSAEGLYTSTVEGQLITTNPAMCSLFGFDDEQQMLAEVTNTTDFYANQEDRELLLGQIYDQGTVLGKEIKGLRRDGSEFWFSLSVQIREENGQKFMFGSIFDITERKQSSISLEYLATHDSLTGVYNRREFERCLRQALTTAKDNESELTLLYMDLDQFKVVNDTCGHKAGDVLIKQLSQQLNDVVMNKGMLARLGGDEFGVLLDGDNAQMAFLLANKLLNVVQEFRFIWDNRIFSLGVSIGMVSWKDNANTPEQLLSMADAACYMAKEQGRNQIHIYSDQDEKMQRYESELTWVTHINNALEENKFELYYQHYYPLKKPAAGHHYELLIRLRDDNGNIVPPASFLPAAERYNLTAQIDRWVIENYFSWLASSPAHKDELSRCNINLSGNSLADKDLKLFILNAFEKYSVPYSKICFEITESMAIVKMEETLQFISTFHQLGCSFALDDFGSGFSSYAYLKSLPVNFVKIDGSFVKDLLVDNIDMAMVCSIKDVASAMGMETVAEFVESPEIMVELGKIGVDYAQGYGVAKPAPLRDFTAYTR